MKEYDRMLQRCRPGMQIAIFIRVSRMYSTMYSANRGFMKTYLESHNSRRCRPGSIIQTTTLTCDAIICYFSLFQSLSFNGMHRVWHRKAYIVDKIWNVHILSFSFFVFQKKTFFSSWSSLKRGEKSSTLFFLACPFRQKDYRVTFGRLHGLHCEIIR